MIKIIWETNYLADNAADEILKINKSDKDL